MGFLRLRAGAHRNILAALDQTNGIIFGPAGTAGFLGMRPTTLASRVRAFGLRKRFLPEAGDQPKQKAGRERPGQLMRPKEQLRD